MQEKVLWQKKTPRRAVSHPKVHRVKMCSWPSTRKLILGFLHSEALRWRTRFFDTEKSRCSEGEVTIV